MSRTPSRLDTSWRHVNRACLAIGRIRDTWPIADQSATEALDDLEERADALLAAIERAFPLVPVQVRR